MAIVRPLASWVMLLAHDDRSAMTPAATVTAAAVAAAAVAATALAAGAGARRRRALAGTEVAELAGELGVERLLEATR